MISNTKTILDEKKLQEIIDFNYVDSKITNITELTDGWFKAIYVLELYHNDLNITEEVVLKTGILKDKYVLSYEKDLMRTEVLVFNLLENTIIPTPKILKTDFSNSIINCDYFIMEKLQGDSWNNLQAEITEQNQEKLLSEIATYTAAMHNIKGEYFGYIKDDKSYQFKDWKSAFINMLDMVSEDGKKANLKLPYDLVMNTLKPYFYLLDEIIEPSLVNFDMWTKNIMLIKKYDEYIIDGIIDLERAFYGDPYADFISSNTICEDVSNNEIFKNAYSTVSKKEFTFTKNDELRLLMYTIYLFLIMGTEVYRYEGAQINKVLEESESNVLLLLDQFKRLTKDI